MSHLEAGSNTSSSAGTAIVDSYQQIQSLASLAEQYNKWPYLDGVFFVPILTKSTEKSVLAKCVTCNEEIKGALKVSSNFSGHLLRKHREKQSEYKAHRISKLTKRFKPLEQTEERIMTRKVTCQFSQTNFHKNVANFVLDNMLPFNIVESKSFQDIFDDFHIKCGRNEITHNLTRQMLLEETDNIYTEMVADIREALNSTKYICTTADIWSSPKKKVFLVSLLTGWQKMLNYSTIILCRSLTSNLISSLEDRMADYFNIVKIGEFAAIVTLTHLKFKSDKWIQCLSTEAQQRVEKLIKNLVNPIKSTQPTSDTKEVDKFFDFGEPAQESFFTQKIVMSTQTSELLQYLSQPVTNDLSTLQDFPKVKDLFLKHNTVIASSAPVERLFSNATLLNLPKFNKLSDFQFEKRVICKINGKQSFCK